MEAGLKEGLSGKNGGEEGEGERRVFSVKPDGNGGEYDGRRAGGAEGLSDASRARNTTTRSGSGPWTSVSQRRG